MNDGAIKRTALRLIGLALSVIPPAVATLMYFPLWREKGAVSVVSGFAVLLLILAAVPAIRYIKERFKTPSAHVMWLLLFIIFLSLSKIADEMTVISFVGFLSNLTASFFFRLGRDEVAK